jgi:hypothetical protein
MPETRFADPLHFLLRIRIQLLSLMRIQIQLYNLMRIRFLIEVMRTCDHYSVVYRLQSSISRLHVSIVCVHGSIFRL